MKREALPPPALSLLSSDFCSLTLPPYFHFSTTTAPRRHADYISEEPLCANGNDPDLVEDEGGDGGGAALDVFDVLGANGDADW